MRVEVQGSTGVVQEVTVQDFVAGQVSSSLDFYVGDTPSLRYTYVTCFCLCYVYF